MSSAPAQAQASPTPILDRLSELPSPAKPKAWAGIVRYLCWNGLFWGLLLLFVSGEGAFLNSVRQGMLRNIDQLVQNDWDGIRVVITILAVASMYYVAVAVHEFGHLLSGLAVGFQFKYLRVGRTRVDRPFRLSRVARVERKWFGEVSFSAAGMRGRPWSRLFMVFSGPGANLILAVVLLYLPFQKSLISGSFILMCAYLGVGNLGPWAPDGKRLFLILFKRKYYEAELALAHIYEQLQAGVDYDELAPELISEIAGLREKSVRTVLGNAIAFAASFQNKDYAAAAASLEICLEFSRWAPESIRQALICDATILQSKRGLLESAEAWFSDIPAGAKLCFRLDADAAIREARGDLNGALNKIVESEQASLQEPDTKRRDLRLRQLRKWKTEIAERMSTVLLQQI